MWCRPPKVRHNKEEALIDALAYSRLKQRDPDFALYREDLEKKVEGDGGGGGVKPR